MPDILVVDDKASLRKVLRDTLLAAGYGVVEAENGRQAVERLERRAVDLVLSDIRMPDLDGIGLLRKVGEIAPGTPVILMTAFGTVETAVEAMKLGAVDYLTKPFASLDEVELKVKRALDARRLARESEAARDEARSVCDTARIVGESPQMREVFDLVRRVAGSGANVLVTGESGTGKELVASALHFNSTRADRPFVRVNCGALAPTLVESELFGHVRGAFTGAVKEKTGRFALADGGTLFLDEIGDIDLATQVKLLRVLQEGEFEPVGSDRTLKVDVRLIAATHRNLRDEIAAGRFREDLYYRLNVIAIELPPLRARGADILLLAERFVADFARKYGKPVGGFDPAARARLLAYAWPGNVRELQNVVERAVVLARGQVVTSGELSPDIGGREPAGPGGSDEPAGPLDDVLDRLERRLVAEALEANAWVQTRTADALGITRTALQYKMQKHGLAKGKSE